MKRLFVFSVLLFGMLAFSGCQGPDPKLQAASVLPSSSSNPSAEPVLRPKVTTISSEDYERLREEFWRKRRAERAEQQKKAALLPIKTKATGKLKPKVGYVPGPSPVYAAQATWYIDPLSAFGPCDDYANTGLTSLVPICTWGQYYQRVGTYQVGTANATTTINIMSSLPPTDPVRTPFVANSASLYVTGSPGATTLLTGTLTGAVAYNPPTNTPASITAAGLAAQWSAACTGSTSCVNQRVRITSGPNAGTQFWIAKDLGAKSARTSTPINYLVSSYTPVVLAGNEPFVVEALPVVSDLVVGPVTTNYSGVAYNPALIFEGLNFFNPAYTSNGPVIPQANVYLQTRFIGSYIGCMDGSYVAYQSQFYEYCYSYSGAKQFNSSLFMGDFSVYPSSYTSYYNGTLIQGGVIGLTIYGGTHDAADLGVMDASAEGIRIETGYLRVHTALWGIASPNTGVDFRGVNAGLSWDGASPPTITDTGGTAQWYAYPFGGTWAHNAAGWSSPSGSRFGMFPANLPEPIFNLAVTLVGGTQTQASGKVLTDASITGVRLSALNASPALGAQVLCTISANNVVCTSYTALGVTAVTDVGTYIVSLQGWQ